MPTLEQLAVLGLERYDKKPNKPDENQNNDPLAGLDANGVPYTAAPDSLGKDVSPTVEETTTDKK